MGQRRRDPGLAAFAVAAAAGAVPFWFAGSSGRRLPPPFESLPLTALGFAVPACAAAAVSTRERTLGPLASRLRPRAGWAWWPAAASAFAVPTLLDGSLRGGQWAGASPRRLGTLTATYVLAALGEEVGWTSFALPRLLEATDSVATATVVSCAYWVAWHTVPFLQTGHSLSWVTAQSVQAALMRATIVGLSCGSGDYGWIAVAVHASSNIAWSCVPEGYRPGVVDLLAAPGTVLALAGSRHAHPSPSRGSSAGRCGGRPGR